MSELSNGHCTNICVHFVDDTLRTILHQCLTRSAECQHLQEHAVKAGTPRSHCIQGLVRPARELSCSAGGITLLTQVPNALGVEWSAGPNFVANLDFNASV